MELGVRPNDRNTFPVVGILIKGSGVKQWVLELQQMGLSLPGVTVYPLPGREANSVWGCLVETRTEGLDIGRNSHCQLVSNTLFIPGHAQLYPSLSDEELVKLFKGKKHILHPEFGLVELDAAVDWSQVIQTPERKNLESVARPASSLFIPAEIRSFQIRALEEKEAIEQMEEKLFPQKQEFSDKPLNLVEKGKLAFYKLLFKKGKGGEGTEEGIKKSPFMTGLERLLGLFSRASGKLTDNLQMNFEELEKRNQKHVDRLLDLLKKNPQEALKYAIPLDTNGTSRGGSGGGLLTAKPLWFSFSLFGNSGLRSGGTSFLGADSFLQLERQYEQTAQELIRQGDHHKAAFIYMKLLKSNHRAAQVLEEGHHYGEAAAIYLRYVKNKAKAAECYEKGKMITEAIELYKELNMNDKIGDLYMTLQKKEEAFFYYTKLANGYIDSNQYVNASQVYRNKMDNETVAGDLLLKGWRQQQDGFNCLKLYFSGIDEGKTLAEELDNIYVNEVNDRNGEVFLQVIRHEYGRKGAPVDRIREMAYEIIVQQIPKNPSIVAELQSFNKKDTLLLKDTMRFKVNMPLPPVGNTNTK